MKKLFLWLIVISMITVFSLVGCKDGEEAAEEAPAGEEAAEEAPAGEEAAEEVEEPERVYYYVGPVLAHPYYYDQYLGFKYAAEQFGVEVIKMGPDDWDLAAAAQSLEQAIAKNPSGLIVTLYDPGMVPGVKDARSRGIPVIVIESTVPDSGGNTYIGLDLYGAGEDTAKELIKRGGTSGKFVMQGNWGAADTEQKLAGFTDYIEANSDWEMVTKVDDKADTTVSIEGAKAAFNNFPDIQGYVGVDSAAGPGIGAAMEELGIEPGSLTVITHDREDVTIEYIEKGYITASLLNKSATQGYLAVALLELWNTKGFGDVPISYDNEAAGIGVMPQFCYTGPVVVDETNFEFFKHDKIDSYDTELFH